MERPCIRRTTCSHPVHSTVPATCRSASTPRREDPTLIDGILTVSPDGYPLRLEGKLAKSPSFWVKSVTVVKHYSRFSGVALPTSIESLADLKMFGRATFTMRYRYSEVDGRTVSTCRRLRAFRRPDGRNPGAARLTLRTVITTSWRSNSWAGVGSGLA